MTIPLALEVQDQWGRTIRLTQEAWIEHILVRHDELTDHLEAVRDTLIVPDAVRYSAIRPDEECFYRFGAASTFPNRYLKVAVRFPTDDNGLGFVNTAYISRRIPRKEAFKWQR